MARIHIGPQKFSINARILKSFSRIFRAELSRIDTIFYKSEQLLAFVVDVDIISLSQRAASSPVSCPSPSIFCFRRLTRHSINTIEFRIIWNFLLEKFPRVKYA